MSGDAPHPIEQACGLTLVDMPDDISPIAVLVIVKCLDADGDVAYHARSTDDLPTVEALGMAHLAAARLTTALTEVSDD